LDPVAVFDDDARKWSSQVHGVPILGSPGMLRVANRALKLDELIVAMPSANRLRIREIVEEVQSLHLPCRILPSMQQVLEGKVSVTSIRPVDIEDLLGREPVALDSEKIRSLIASKVILVTGAGGSIGSELCRQIIHLQPARLLMIERCEAALFGIEQELVKGGYSAEVLPLVMDVCDEISMRATLERHRPSVIFHAAAHKHVPLMEHQPGEAFRNNTQATTNLAQWSAERGVDRFVLISTDKAINPTNVMGVTKRLAEISLQALQGKPGVHTKLMAVRFGNVLGSSGSVIPTFKRQILEGGPVTVTHPDVTRYFMTIPEAVGLVLQASTLGTGGDIFVLDMGEPVKIVNVARHLIRLSGLEPDKDIEIQFTGLRPGEKLYEELNLSHESIKSTEHVKIRRYTSTMPDLAQWAQQIEDLAAKTRVMEPIPLKLEFKKLVPEYLPYLQ
jgi:FlaA1/EpsC-like NDP-sugar epimerase